MKRTFETMQGTKAPAERSVRFAASTVVYDVDCSETTKSLFYGKSDYAQFQSDYIAEQKQTGCFRKMAARKRRQLNYQHETLTEIRRRRIENRILDIIHQGQTQLGDQQNDICFQRRCIPLQTVSIMNPSKPQQSGMAHAA